MNPKVGTNRLPKKGERTPGSGRPKGLPNKNTKTLMERAEALGVDPFKILLLFANNDWKGLGYTENSITNDQRLNATKEASKYLYPQRRAIEVSGPDGGDIPLKSRAGEQILAELKDLLQTKIHERKP